MNDPYTAPTMRLGDLDLVAWRLYEKANARAKRHYYALRTYIDNLETCPVCGGLTYAASGIHTFCKEKQA